MSKLTTGTLLVIGAPVIYVCAVLFHLIPFYYTLQAFGGCGPADEPIGQFYDYQTNHPIESPQMCWDAIGNVIDPLGLVMVICFAALFLTGLVLIGVYIHQRSMVRRVLTLLADIAVTLALVYFMFIAAFNWLEYFKARSPSCNEIQNSIIYCDSGTYLPASIGFSIISIMLLVLVVAIARKELKAKHRKK